MKYALIFALLFSSTFAQARIENSTLSEAHQQVLSDALLKACGVHRAGITQTRITERTEHIDNGIVDVYASAEFRIHHRIDQGQYDRFIAHANYAIYDGYDHQLKEWGLLTIGSVTCYNE